MPKSSDSESESGERSKSDSESSSDPFTLTQEQDLLLNEEYRKIFEAENEFAREAGIPILAIRDNAWKLMEKVFELRVEKSVENLFRDAFNGISFVALKYPS